MRLVLDAIMSMQTVTPRIHPLNGEVCVNGQWYIADPQLGISTVEAAGIPFLMSESTYTGIFGMTWDHTGLPSCPNDYR